MDVEAPTESANSGDCLLSDTSHDNRHMSKQKTQKSKHELWSTLKLHVGLATALGLLVIIVVVVVLYLLVFRSQPDADGTDVGVTAKQLQFSHDRTNAEQQLSHSLTRTPDLVSTRNDGIRLKSDLAEKDVSLLISYFKTIAEGMPYLDVDEDDMEDYQTNAEGDVENSTTEFAYSWSSFDKPKKQAKLMYKSTDAVMSLFGETRHAFLNAILFAYNNHLNLEISPDDILQCFTMVVSQHVNDNAEKYRSVFVNHLGKKNLVVISDGDSSTAWPHLLDLMSDLIDKDIKSSLNLESDFSVSNRVTQNVATIMKMGTFKQYFNYGFTLTCGIPSVSLTGTDDDWLKLKSKVTNCTQLFNEIDPGNNFSKWSKHFVGIIDWLIVTRQYIGRDDLPDHVKRFWSRIITYIPFGSGREKYISGWVRILFPGSKFGSIPSDIEFRNFDTAVKCMDESIETVIKEPPHSDYEYKGWVFSINEQAEGTTQVKAEMNHFGRVYDVFLTAGHIGFTLHNKWVAAQLGYYIHALPKDKAEITV